MKLADYSGTSFGNLLLIERFPKSRKYKCLCSCGNFCNRTQSYLLRNKDKNLSCGCLHKSRVTVYKFNTKIHFWRVKEYHKDINSYRCECICGTSKMYRPVYINFGLPKSCGCKRVYGSRLNHKHLNKTKLNNLFSGYRINAQNKDRVFDLDFQLFEKLVLSNCHYCGNGLSNCIDWASGRHKKNSHKFYYNGIDRIDNTLGYTKDNVVTCCKDCNFAKHKMTNEEWISWLNRIISFNYPRQNK